MNTMKLSAGNNIEARCTRCRKVLNHTIVAMVGELVVRVECNTCHGVHNYHRGTETKATAATAPVRKTSAASGKTKKDPGAADREEWESLRPAMVKEQAVAYDMNRKYRVKSLVDHPVFGLGVVKLISGPNKMEVLFQGGKRLLRCE
jgi:hypothetical protein